MAPPTVRRRSLLLASVAALASVSVARAQTDAQAQRAPVLAAVNGMFDALKRGDTAGMRSFMHAEGRIVQTGFRDGEPFHRVNPLNGFLSSVGGAVAQGRKLEEQIHDPDVRIEDNLAHVWARYDFFVDGAKTHCGVDSYHVVRTAAGWKILEIVDTQRRPCPQ